MGRSKNEINKKAILKRVKFSSFGCWLWQGTKTKGYGQYVVGGKKYRAHRITMHLWKNFDLNSPLLICHHCDNPSCVNPKHLFVGTVTDNILDSVSKGRWVNNRGENSGMAKFTEEKLIELDELRGNGFTFTAIGMVYGISRQYAWALYHRKYSWKHITKINSNNKE